MKTPEWPAQSGETRWLIHVAHKLDVVLGLAQAGQAAVLKGKSYRQAGHIVSRPLQRLAHKKQRLPENKAMRFL
jgi:hypothetical protein